MSIHGISIVFRQFSVFSGCNTSVRCDPVPAHALLVQLCVAIPAHQFQVVPVKRDLRIVYVVRRQVHLVVHDLSRLVHSALQTSLAQPTHALRVCCTAVLPRLRFVESSGPLLHLNYLPAAFPLQSPALPDLKESSGNRVHVDSICYITKADRDYLYPLSDDTIVYRNYVPDFRLLIKSSIIFVGCSD